ncbi:MAG: Ig domain-containing protein [Gemmatimonadota bacterium]
MQEQEDRQDEGGQVRDAPGGGCPQRLGTVDAEQGLVTAAGVGNATITAEVEGRTASLQVTVTLIPVGSVTFPVTTDTLIPNDQKQFNPVVRDTAGNVITSLLGRNVNYTPSNNLIISTATAASGVIVSAQNSIGTATVTATIDNVVSAVPLTVRVAQIGQVTIDPSAATVAVGSSVQLTVTIKDENGNALTLSRPIIAYSSNATAVATVPAQGGQVVTVTARAPGTTVITANINGFPASATITVP